VQLLFRPRAGAWLHVLLLPPSALKQDRRRGVGVVAEFLGCPQALWLNLTNGNDLGGGKPVLTGPSFVDSSNIEKIATHAANNTPITGSSILTGQPEVGPVRRV
jgi:hypothetical protein